MASIHSVGSSTSVFLLLLLLSTLVVSTMGLFKGKSWKAHGRNVLITGGSQGLGLAVAQLLASKGAHVTICSRTESKLKQAVQQVKVSLCLRAASTCVLTLFTLRLRPRHPLNASTTSLQTCPPLRERAKPSMLAKSCPTRCCAAREGPNQASSSSRPRPTLKRA